MREDEDGTEDLSIGTSRPIAYSHTGVDAGLLERFANPYRQRMKDLVGGTYHGTVHIEVPEFTSLCPMTGQPDFATIVIDYVPDEWCVESRALKLYMFSFRNQGEFHEACTARIARDLFDLLQPYELSVEGRFTPRGGIPFWPTIHMAKEIPSLASLAGAGRSSAPINLAEGYTSIDFGPKTETVACVCGKIGAEAIASCEKLDCPHK